MANKINLTQEKLEALRTEYKQRNNKQGKYPRQKMLPEYQCIYPWVMADEEDPYFAFCTVCECRLSAKRSDLGKHESSIKHKENSTKRQPDGGGEVVLKGCHQIFGSLNEPASDANDLGDALFIKQEPSVESLESSSINVINLEQLQSPSVRTEDKFESTDDKQATDQNQDDNDDEDDDEEEDDDDDENSNSSVYDPPAAKRRVSETDSQSQHSSVLDYLPVQVTITEGAPIQSNRFGVRKPQTNSAHTSPIVKQPIPVTGSLSYPTLSSAPGVSPGQTPCKITIKKITQPRAGNIQITAASPSNAPTALCTMANLNAHNKLTLPGHSAALLPQNPANFVSMPMQMQVAPNRDAFELFFDSICTSVRSLPPKLATEGKIRVMQLVGELELRAISEREQETTTRENIVTDNNGTSSSTMTAGSQQNSTVASTTK